MKSARTLIGLPVILECKPLGYICQATPDERLDHLERIYFSSGTGARMIERDQVDAIGEVAMLVHAPGKRAQLPESFCKDAGQQALAKAVELGGGVLALYALLPLASSVAELLQRMAGGG